MMLLSMLVQAFATLEDTHESVSTDAEGNTSQPGSVEAPRTRLKAAEAGVHIEQPQDWPSSNTFASASRGARSEGKRTRLMTGMKIAQWSKSSHCRLKTNGGVADQRQAESHDSSCEKQPDKKVGAGLVLPLQRRAAFPGIV